jgi:hypothetical protein
MLLKIIYKQKNKNNMEKVEIEKSELEQLKQKLQEITKENKELRSLINPRTEKKWKDIARRLAYRIYEKYMYETFNQLGFKSEHYEGCIIFPSGIHSELFEEIYKRGCRDDIRIELDARITNSFREAFLRIGVIPKEKRESQKDDPFRLV